ncbi:ribosome silencing factor [Bacteriovorax sp. Seq25_V]|uniref:ribosome silencing factor n=1 Tax=Bacteriovorax sp. Seq25_V TaxID=1201288 RepID=UPI00038A3947|nr:ribosome silencing factor [Bacteriovorax sp. Seq25_V]EQC44691.1 iojap-like protein [Bacteriovorax sp. Seq25_V]
MSSNEFINKNVDEILSNKEIDSTLAKAMACAWICGNFKGINLKILDMKKSTSLGDYFVLASATNFTQASAMGQEITVQMKRVGLEVLSREGINNGADWLLIDLGDFIVHIFQETARHIYDLDNLWDAPSIQIPNEYYYSSDMEESTSGSAPKGYF